MADEEHPDDAAFYDYVFHTARAHAADCIAEFVTLVYEGTGNVNALEAGWDYIQAHLASNAENQRTPKRFSPEWLESVNARIENIGHILERLHLIEAAEDTANEGAEPLTCSVCGKEMGDARRRADHDKLEQRLTKDLEGAKVVFNVTCSPECLNKMMQDKSGDKGTRKLVAMDIDLDADPEPDTV